MMHGSDWNVKSTHKSNDAASAENQPSGRVYEQENTVEENKKRGEVDKLMNVLTIPTMHIDAFMEFSMFV